MADHSLLAFASAALFTAIAAPAVAQNAAPSSAAGTVVVMTGAAELELPNDEALVHFYYEHQDADLTKAQAAVNRRVADGMAALKQADPKAEIETAGYGATPVYSAGSGRTLVGWRVRQGVALRTENLTALPKTVAAAQATLALGGVDFRLSRAARDKAQAQLIQQAIANLNSRVAAAANALGVPPNRVRLEEVNFGGREGGPMPLGAPRMAAMSSDAVPAPSFEAGRSVERMTVTGKARLLP